MTHSPDTPATPDPALAEVLARTRAILAEVPPQIRAAAIAQLSPAQPVAQEPVAFRMVPTEPTPEMIGAWYRYKNGHHYHDEPAPTDRSDYGAYRAMLFAAPAHPATPAPVEAGLREAVRILLDEHWTEIRADEGDASKMPVRIGHIRALECALRAQSAPVGGYPVTVGVDLASGPLADDFAVTIFGATQEKCVTYGCTEQAVDHIVMGGIGSDFCVTCADKITIARQIGGAA